MLELDREAFLDLVFLEFEGWAVTKPSRRLGDVASKSDELLRDQLRAGREDWDFDRRVLGDWNRWLESGELMAPLVLRPPRPSERVGGSLYIENGNHRALALARAILREERSFTPVRAVFDGAVYIRHGLWCECERSCNDAKGRLEPGISVYECENLEGPPWKPSGAAWDKNERQVVGSATPWFLVAGEVLGPQGGDGEPLLEKLGFRARLSWSETASAFVEVAGSVLHPLPHNTHNCGQVDYQALQEQMYGSESDNDEDSDGADCEDENG